MAGVRVIHPLARNARFLIADSSRPYPEPYQCTAPEFGGCGGTHIFKTHHLNIDETGSCIIGDELFKQIRHILVANGFEEANTVEKPPTIQLGIGPQVEGRGAWGNIPIIKPGE